MIFHRETANDQIIGDASGPPPGVPARSEVIWGQNTARSELFLRNVSMTYLAKGVEIAIGLAMLPFNVSHLGQSVYGLWILAASIPAYFSMLDLGYGVAQVKFVAKYRASGDRDGLNQIISTMFFVFTLIGLVALIVAVAAALNLGALFDLTGSEAETGRDVLLLVGLHVAIGFPFSVFGGVVNGFQRYHLNSVVAIGTAIVVATVNVAVVLAGYGLVALVAATTMVRILSLLVYRANAYRAFPGLSLRLGGVSAQRLREVTGFSVFILLIDVANKLNYSTDVPVIGAFMGASAVAVWAVAQRLITTVQDLTTQVSGALFPVVVDIATVGETERLREVFLQGTRLSLAMVVPAATALALVAGSLISAWVGPDFSGSVPVVWVLAGAVVVRVGNSTATTVLKGGGRHSFLTAANLAMALANLVLSIVLVRILGLIGVALGTFVPLAAVSILALFPQACRRVEISILDAIKRGVWPSVWPVVPAALVLATSRNMLGHGLPAVALQALLSVAVYTTVFLAFAISRRERDWYVGKMKQFAVKALPMPG